MEDEHLADEANEGLCSCMDVGSGTQYDVYGERVQHEEACT